MLFWLAQFMGLLGALSNVISSWQKTRKKMLFFLIFDTIFYTIQYLLLQAYVGACTNSVGLIRTITFSKKKSNKFFSTNWILYIIFLLYIIAGIVSLYFDGQLSEKFSVISLFPIVASILYAIVLWQDKPKSIRIGSAIMLFMWCIYNIYVKAYLGAVVEFVLMCSTIIAIIKIDIIDVKKQKSALPQNEENTKNNENVEISNQQ